MNNKQDENLDQLEEKLRKKSITKKPHMKVSGKSVFLLVKQAGKKKQQ